MRMFLWNFTNPMRDGALENDIVVHENTHGISNRRMTGGGTGRCLQTTEPAGGMGEGWSDAMAEWTEHNSAAIVDFVLGQYVINDPNVMMDAESLYPEGHHPVRRNYTPDGIYRITPLTRSERPVRYFYIDFGLSTRFSPGSSSNVVGEDGRDTDVPELSADTPYDACKVDVFSLGNLYDKEFQEKYHDSDMDFLVSLIAIMKREDPSTRPSIEDAIAHWQRSKSGMKSSTPRRRLSLKSEPTMERVYNDAVAVAWQGLTKMIA